MFPLFPCNRELGRTGYNRCRRERYSRDSRVSTAEQLPIWYSSFRFPRVTLEHSVELLDSQRYDYAYDGKCQLVKNKTC